jgi:16S rRNA (adenine1518-N6/adenine1519-N6)-dimethyltransferase
VHGAFVGLERRAPAVPLERMGAFRSTVSAAFAYRRKTIANSIAASRGREAAAAALDAARIDPRRRAETLSLDEFVMLDAAWREIDAEKNL